MSKGPKLIFIALSCCILAGADPVASQSMNNRSPLVFPDNVWELGEVMESEGTVSHDFVFTNQGSEYFVIERITSNCGCAAASYPKKPVPPGGSGVVTVTFDPANMPGVFLKKVRVIGGEGKNINVLTLKGQVVARPRVTEELYPYILGDGLRIGNISANFGQVVQGVGKTVSIPIINTSSRTVSILFGTDSEAGLVSFPKLRDICPGCTTEVPFEAFVPLKGFYGRFFIDVHPIVNGQRVPAPIVAFGLVTDDFEGVDALNAPRARFFPTYHVFKAKVRRGVRQTADFTLRNEGNSPLVIREVSNGDEVFSSLEPGTVIRPKTEVVFTVTLDTSNAKQKTSSGVISIVTNDPLNPLRDIRLVSDLF